MKKFYSFWALGAMLSLCACDIPDEPEPDVEISVNKGTWVLSSIYSEDDGGWSQEYTYDSHGRIIAINDSGEPCSTTYSYNSQSICREIDERAVFTLGNGRVVRANIFGSDFSYSYNSAGRLESIFTSDSARSKKFRFNWDATSLTSLSVNEDSDGMLPNYTIEFTTNTFSSEINPDCIRFINAYMLAGFTEAIDMNIAQSGVFGEMSSELIYSATQRGGEDSGYEVRFSCGNIDSNRCPRTLTVVTSDEDSPATIQLTWKQI